MPLLRDFPLLGIVGRAAKCLFQKKANATWLYRNESCFQSHLPPWFHVMFLRRPNSDTHDSSEELPPGYDPGSRIQKCVTQDTAILSRY